ncbi:MAG: N-acetyltransferase family protein [Erysipelotrichia bacterium]|nr:N-acetyltransferase family protein [Erysipelotrichia bacterium]NCC54606.1 N-acetyltransferase family protein [Erysipelotrichia bacterium]
MKTVKIRNVQLSDTQELLAIYAPYVKESAITFEYEVPSIEEFKERIMKITKQYPYLVALLDNEMVGYAYASSFHERAAYQWCAEVSIYLKKEVHKQGVGKQLYAQLEKMLKKQNIKNMNACITYPNESSIAFHERMGFKTVGHFHHCGYKLGKWWDMVWMEKMIAEHKDEPEAFIPINDIKKVERK